MTTPLTRRTFLKTSALAAAGFAVGGCASTSSGPTPTSRVVGANSDVRVGVAGLNGRGAALLKNFKALRGVRVVALCDVDTAVLQRAAAGFNSEQGGSVATFVDFRQMLEQPDLDAVVIATPNHQHSLQAIWAVQAGKDVYVEKPISHNVWEGRQLVAAARKHNRIVQAGTQCRSSTGLAEAVAWVQAGNLGRVTVSRGLCYKRRDSIGRTTGEQPVPSTVNYDLWTGPAPLRPLQRERLHYDWHWQWATGNGDLGNQGIHQVDIARWFLGEPALAPRVLSVGGRLGYVDDGETPNTQIIVQDYARAPLIFEVRGLPARPRAKEMDEYHDTSIGVVVHCEGGRVVVPSYTTAMAYDRDGKLVREWKGATSHMGNFVDAMRSRRSADLHGQIEAGHISSALCHTGNISHRLGRTLPSGQVREQIRGDAALTEAVGRMVEHLAVNGVDLNRTPLTLGVPLLLDPQTERFTGEHATVGNPLLSREYRQPYVVPKLA